jgi:hydroxymethylbilane synthase
LENSDTRLAKLDAVDGPYTALILAKAGLVRMGMTSRITADLTPPIFYHAVGQGALAVEIRSEDVEARELCKTLTHTPTQWLCLAERACLRVLEGGCSVPVGVQSMIDDDDCLDLTACVTSVDGQHHVQCQSRTKVSDARSAEEIGEKVAKMLMSDGAQPILDEIAKQREEK